MLTLYSNMSCSHIIQCGNVYFLIFVIKCLLQSSSGWDNMITVFWNSHRKLELSSPMNAKDKYQKKQTTLKNLSLNFYETLGR